MSVLEQARKAYAKLKTLRNGRYEGAPIGPAGCDKSDISAESPPASTKVQTRDCAVSDKSDKSPGSAFTLVRQADQLTTVLQAVDESVAVGLDTETTGLNPRTDRVRLLSLATDRGTYLVDAFAVDPRPLWDVLAEKTLVMHNGAFDLGMLRPLGFEPGPVRCTMLLSQLLHAGHLRLKHTLAAVTERELGRKLDKSEQKSEWTGKLTFEQLAYAAADADVLVSLYTALDAAIRKAGMERVADVEMRCLPAVAWIAAAGVPFDAAAWEALAEKAEAEVADLSHRLDGLAPPRPGDMPGMTTWNWNSGGQLLELFKLLGMPLENTQDETLAEVDHPLAALLREYRGAAKRASTYGRKFLECVVSGRIYPDWKQCGARTGRLSGAKPNLQQIPGDVAYRRCFHPGEGRVLVRADYSQIELRIACKIANEAVMLAEYQSPDADLHALTARKILGVAEVTAAQRKLAKPINFGLIYGLGARSLARKARLEYGVPMTIEQAKGYSRLFFDSYPALRTWHHKIDRQKATETRTLLGRRVYVDRGASPGKKANYAVQGSGGDGIKLAMALLWERRHQCPETRPVLTVHDEIVLECPAEQAAEATAWLRQCMLDAMQPMIDPVPLDVQPEVLPTWGGA